MEFSSFVDRFSLPCSNYVRTVYFLQKTVYWNGVDALGFAKLWTSLARRIHIVTSDFNICPSRDWYLIWVLIFSSYLGWWTRPFFFRGGSSTKQLRRYEVPPQATASRNSWAPTRPVPWTSLSFLDGKQMQGVITWFVADVGLCWSILAYDSWWLHFFNTFCLFGEWFRYCLNFAHLLSCYKSPSMTINGGFSKN